ncbi:hypothetical protein Pyn_25340 [Prunus yedoensis var. nudiflora]|uniref:Uncharacterized protein n=1 Tax=Prunus yedoensis var. nudiflora TaxID=2094558 RepID=A0A314UGF7_PRUYE|nr:hypothetical protein Pyn_25340 [Prunus yedoensis var. nudiflora]
MKLGLLLDCSSQNWALNTSCLGRVFWGDDREGDGEQLLLRNDREIRSLRQQKVDVKLGLRQATSAGLVQPKLALNSGCLGRIIWGAIEKVMASNFRKGMMAR